MTAGAEPARLSALLVGAALHDPDWRAVQDLCLELLDGTDTTLAATAVTSLGHLARLHRDLDKERVVAAITAKADDPIIGRRVPDSLDDIDTFVA